MMLRLISQMAIILDVTDGVKIDVTDGVKIDVTEDDTIGCHRLC